MSDYNTPFRLPYSHSNKYVVPITGDCATTLMYGYGAYTVPVTNWTQRYNDLSLPEPPIANPDFLYGMMYYSNQRPLVSFRIATDTLEEGGLTILSASTLDIDGYEQTVSYYADSALIGSSSQTPYTVTWAPVVGTYSVVKAVAVGKNGVTAESISRKVTVTPKGAPLFVSRKMLLTNPTVQLLNGGTYNNGVVEFETYNSQVNLTTNVARTAGKRTILEVDMSDMDNYSVRAFYTDYSFNGNMSGVGSYEFVLPNGVAPITMGFYGKSKMKNISIYEVN